MKKPTQGLITATRSPAEEREAHMNTVTHKIKQPLERVLPAVGLRSPLLRGGQWRCIDVAVCPVCGEAAPPDRTDLSPWTFGSTTIRCAGGCEIDARGLLELFCKTDQELDAALAKISVGRPQLKRFYCFELLLIEEQGDTPAKFRRVIGDDMIATLARLEPDKDSTVRGVAVDAPDLLAAQAAVRSCPKIPWSPVPLDQRGKLTRLDWHGAAMSQVERELARRMAV